MHGHPRSRNEPTTSARRWAWLRRLSAAAALSSTNAAFCCVTWSSWATLSSVAAGVILYNYVESRQQVFGRNLTTAMLAVMVTGALAVESISW